MGNVAIVSMHEKGFPQADLYYGASEWKDDDWQSGRVPDEFFTCSKGDSIEVAFVKAADKWPGCLVIIASEDSDDDQDED